MITKHDLQYARDEPNKVASYGIGFTFFSVRDQNSWGYYILNVFLITQTVVCPFAMK